MCIIEIFGEKKKGNGEGRDNLRTFGFWELSGALYMFVAI